MSDQPTRYEIYSGIILQKNKIAEHTYHIKVQSTDFARMHYDAGFTLDVFLSNPYDNPQSEVRPYSFWNYEPVYQVADFAINTFSNGKGAQWIQTVQKGDTIFYTAPVGEFTMDDTADHYFLIGDVTALSHLYEINRAVAVSKEVTSLIYAQHAQDFFPDLDHSYPLKTYTLKTFCAEEIIELIKKHFPRHTPNSIAYIFGDSVTTTSIYDFLKDNPAFDIRRIFVKNFWNSKSPV